MLLSRHRCNQIFQRDRLMPLLPLSCRRRIMLFPSGNWTLRSKKPIGHHTAVYVECPDLDEEEPGWGLVATFHITLVNQLDPSSNFCKGLALPLQSRTTAPAQTHASHSVHHHHHHNRHQHCCHHPNFCHL